MGSPTLESEVRSISWFHRIELPGIVTPGVDDSPHKLAELHLPDLRGKTFLDVGAWDGYFSFEAERRGASRVLATDSFVWEGKTWGSKRGFDLAKRALGSKVEERTIDPMDLAPEAVGTWDVVLYSGVLYHMRHPLLALERVASVTKDLLIVETFLDLMFCRRPAIAFYPGAEASDDPTTWCGPNEPAVRAMLRDVGFGRVERVHHRSLPLRAARAGKWAAKGRNPVAALQQGRAVYHARRS